MPRQIRVLIAIECAIVAMAAAIAFTFWRTFCGDGLSGCLGGEQTVKPIVFFALSILRPFVLTPHIFIALLAGRSFDPFTATIYTAAAGTLSYLMVHWIAYALGKRMVIPWLGWNLPSTLTFLQSQDYKIAFACRLIPILPFDLCSLFFGLLHFRLRWTIVATFLGLLPESFVLCYAMSPDVAIWGSTVSLLGLSAVGVLMPLLVFEATSRRRGTSMWPRLKAMYKEILAEVRINNEIHRRYAFHADKTPVLLLYGFFSSRRVMSVLEKQLIARGHDVLSFNLGGLLGTFFTAGIDETALFIDGKIKRQMARHGFKKIQIIAHSKGGLVAYWWLFKLGGSKICDKVIAVGAPCNGSFYTYLALVTPLAFFWKDVWQMRPGSTFLKVLQDSVIPENMQVHAIYSDRDSVSRGNLSILRPRVGYERVKEHAMSKFSHFEFVYKREAIEEIITILEQDKKPPTSDNLSETA